MTERRTWALAAGAGLLGLGLWLAIALAAPSQAEAPTVTLTYVAAADDEGVADLDGGWSTTTDLGYEVTVDQYVVRTWSAVVSTCDEADADGLAVSELFAVAGASAAHSDAPDPAQAIGPVEQDLAVATGPAALGQGVITADTVCQAHVAVAGGEGSGDGRTEPTVEVSGTYTGPDQDEAVPFTISADQAWGGMVELDEIDLGGEPVTVLVVRELAELLDDVDFDATTEDERADAVLRSLTAATTVEVVAAT